MIEIHLINFLIIVKNILFYDFILFFNEKPTSEIEN